MPCARLDNDLRVFSTRGVSRVMGSRKTGTNQTGTGAPQPPPFLAAKNLSSFISEDLIVRLNPPVVYRAKRGGRTAYGYEATLLPDICSVILDAERAGSLRVTQLALAARARALLTAFAKTGVIAVVDEATGFEAERAKGDLQRLLEQYVVEEMRPWLAVFPTEFFRQVYRLHGWQFREGHAQHPQLVGKLINEWIYRRLPGPVLPELRRRNPIIGKRRRHKHHQYLTEDTGIPHLDRQIASVITLMRVSRDKRRFEENLRTAFPKHGDQTVLAVDPEDIDIDA